VANVAALFGIYHTRKSLLCISVHKRGVLNECKAMRSPETAFLGYVAVLSNEARGPMNGLHGDELFLFPTGSEPFRVNLSGFSDCPLRGTIAAVTTCVSFTGQMIAHWDSPAVVLKMARLERTTHTLSRTPKIVVRNGGYCRAGTRVPRH